MRGRKAGFFAQRERVWRRSRTESDQTNTLPNEHRCNEDDDQRRDQEKTVRATNFRKLLRWWHRKLLLKISAVPDNTETQNRSRDPLFPQTNWSALSQTREVDSSHALQGLERLARAYWRPLYIFARQRGAGHEDAADSVQGFFGHLLSGGVLAGVERRETRFRTFLLAVFKNWLADEHARATAQKRGGGVAHLALSEFDSMRMEPALVTDEAPEECFDRRWARAVFDNAVARLDAELTENPRAEYFLEVRRRTIGAAGAPEWDAVAVRFSTTENAVKQIAHTMRQRFAVLLKLEVLSVVSSEADLAEEMRYLVRLLSA